MTFFQQSPPPPQCLPGPLHAGARVSEPEPTLTGARFSLRMERGRQNCKDNSCSNTDVYEHLICKLLAPLVFIPKELYQVWTIFSFVPQLPFMGCLPPAVPGRWQYLRQEWGSYLTFPLQSP